MMAVTYGSMILSDVETKPLDRSQAEMSQHEGAMPPQDLPNRAPHFSRAASSGRGAQPS